MKVGLFILFAAIGVSGAFAQDATATGAKQKSLPTPPRKEIQVETPQAPKELTVDTNLLANPNPTPKKESRINYSGFITDVRRSTNRWKMFSLRKPVDPAHDGENLMDAHSEAGPGIKLFSIGFK
jgi:hypothetical protein